MRAKCDCPLQVTYGSVEFPHLGQREAEVSVSGGEPRCSLQRGKITSSGGFVLVGISQRDAEIDVHIRVPRREQKCCSILGDGFFDASGAVKKGAEIEFCPSVIWLPVQCHSKSRLCSLVITDLQQRNTKIVVIRRVVRSKTERALVSVDRFGNPAEILESVAEISMCRGKIWTPPNGLTASIGSLRGLSAEAEGIAEIGVSFGKIAP